MFSDEQVILKVCVNKFVNMFMLLIYSVLLYKRLFIYYTQQIMTGQYSSHNNSILVFYY